MAHDKKRRRGKKRKRTSEKIAEAIRRMRHPVESLIEDMGQELASVVDFYTIASRKISEKMKSLSGGLWDHLSKSYNGLVSEHKALDSLATKVRGALFRTLRVSKRLFDKIRDHRVSDCEMSVREEMSSAAKMMAEDKERVDNEQVKLKPVPANQSEVETRELTRLALKSSNGALLDRAEEGEFKKDSIFVRGIRRFSNPIYRVAQMTTLVSGLLYAPIHTKVELWPHKHHDLPTITQPFRDEGFKHTKEMEKSLKNINESASKVKKGVPDDWRDKWMILVPMEKTPEGTLIRKDYEIDDEPCVLTFGRTVYIPYA